MGPAGSSKAWWGRPYPRPAVWCPCSSAGWGLSPAMLTEPPGVLLHLCCSRVCLTGFEWPGRLFLPPDCLASSQGMLGKGLLGCCPVPSRETGSRCSLTLTAVCRAASLGGPLGLTKCIPQPPASESGQAGEPGWPCSHPPLPWAVLCMSLQAVNQRERAPSLRFPRKPTALGLGQARAAPPSRPSQRLRIGILL